MLRLCHLLNTGDADDRAWRQEATLQRPQTPPPPPPPPTHTFPTHTQGSHLTVALPCLPTFWLPLPSPARPCATPPPTAILPHIHDPSNTQLLMTPPSPKCTIGFTHRRPFTIYRSAACGSTREVSPSAYATTGALFPSVRDRPGLGENRSDVDASHPPIPDT